MFNSGSFLNLFEQERCENHYNYRSGVNVLIFNSATIFKAAEVDIDDNLAANVVGVTQLVATASKMINDPFDFPV